MTSGKKTACFVRALFITAMTVGLTQVSYAGKDKGSESGGGGDAATEMRIDAIRADILKWISEGGAQGLKLPPSLTHAGYVGAMEKLLAKHTVVIGSVTPAEEREAEASGDEELQVKVNGQPKTCRGFISSKDGLPHILCSTQRFAATSQSDQYRLIHHEYAGLAGVERNVGASSDYEISNQLTDYLSSEMHLRLSVTRKTPVLPGPETKISQGMVMNLTLTEDLSTDDWDDYVISRGDCRILLNDTARSLPGSYSVLRVEVKDTYTEHQQSAAGWPFSGGSSWRFTRMDVLDDSPIRAIECRFKKSDATVGALDKRIRDIGFAALGTLTRPIRCTFKGGCIPFHPYGCRWQIMSPERKVLASHKGPFPGIEAKAQSLIEAGTCTTVVSPPARPVPAL